MDICKGPDADVEIPQLVVDGLACGRGEVGKLGAEHRGLIGLLILAIGELFCERHDKGFVFIRV